MRVACQAWVFFVASSGLANSRADYSNDVERRLRRTARARTRQFVRTTAHKERFSRSAHAMALSKRSHEEAQKPQKKTTRKNTAIAALCFVSSPSAWRVGGFRCGLNHLNGIRTMGSFTQSDKERQQCLFLTLFVTLRESNSGALCQSHRLRFRTTAQAELPAREDTLPWPCRADL